MEIDPDTRKYVLENNPQDDGRIRNKSDLGSRSHTKIIDIKGKRIVYFDRIDDRGEKVNLIGGIIVGKVFMEDDVPKVRYRTIDSDYLNNLVQLRFHPEKVIIT